MPRLSLVVVALALAITGGTASAQKQMPKFDIPTERLDIDVDAWIQGMEPLLQKLETASPALGDIVKGTFRRARRKVSIGPTLGVFAGYAEGADVALTFGIGLELFKVPVLPTMDNLKVLIRERLKAKLKQAIIDTFKGQPPPTDEASIAKLVEEAWIEAVKEILGMENIRPKTMERPQLTIAFEGNRYFDSNTWATRLRLGAGFWKVTLAASTAVGFTDPKAAVYVGPELVVHFLMSKGGRASVLDVFIRADLEVRSRGETYSQDIYTLGARYLLDLI